MKKQYAYVVLIATDHIRYFFQASSSLELQREILAFKQTFISSRNYHKITTPSIHTLLLMLSWVQWGQLCEEQAQKPWCESQNPSASLSLTN
jgi:hypothetical protein